MIEIIIAAVMSFVTVINGPVEPANPNLGFERADRGAQVQLREPPPPPPTIPVWDDSNDGHTCHGAIPLLTHFSPGWDVNAMARIMWRESNCKPWVTYSNPNVSSATGLLQILWRTHCPWIREEFGECSQAWLQDPVNNIRAAASLYQKQGSSAWAQTR